MHLERNESIYSAASSQRRSTKNQNSIVKSSIARGSIFQKKSTRGGSIQQSISGSIFKLSNKQSNQKNNEEVVIELNFFENETERVDIMKFITELVLRQKYQFSKLQESHFLKSELNLVDQIQIDIDDYYEDMFKHNHVTQLKELYKNKFVKIYYPSDVCDAILNLGLNFNDEYMYWLALAYLNAPLPQNFKMTIRNNQPTYIHYPSETAFTLHPIYNYIQKVIQDTRIQMLDAITAKQELQKRDNFYVIFKINVENKTARFIQMLHNPTLKQLSYAQGDTESITLHIDVITQLRPCYMELRDALKRPYKVDIKLHLLRSLQKKLKQNTSSQNDKDKFNNSGGLQMYEDPSKDRNKFYPRGYSRDSNLLEQQLDRLVQLIEFVGDISSYLTAQSINIESPIDLFVSITEEKQAEIEMEIRRKKNISIRDMERENLIQHITQITKIPKCLKPFHILAIIHDLGIDIWKDINCLVVLLEFVTVKSQDALVTWEFKINDQGFYYWINTQIKQIQRIYPYKDELLNIIEIFKFCQQKEMEKYKPLQSQLEKFMAIADENILKSEAKEQPLEDFAQNQLIFETRSFILEFLEIRPKDMFTLLGANQAHTNEWTPKKVFQFLRSQVKYNMKDWVDLLFYWPFEFNRRYFKIQKDELNKPMLPTTNKLLVKNAEFFEGAQKLTPEDFVEFFQKFIYEDGLDENIVTENQKTIGRYIDFIQQKEDLEKIQLQAPTPGGGSKNMSIQIIGDQKTFTHSLKKKSSRGSLLKDIGSFSGIDKIKKAAEDIVLVKRLTSSSKFSQVEDQLENKFISMKKMRANERIMRPLEQAPLFNIELIEQLREIKREEDQKRKKEEDKQKRRNVNSNQYNKSFARQGGANQSIIGRQSQQNQQSITQLNDISRKVKQKVETLQKNILPTLSEINENEEQADTMKSNTGLSKKTGKLSNNVQKAIQSKMQSNSTKNTSALDRINQLQGMNELDRMLEEEDEEDEERDEEKEEKDSDISQEISRREEIKQLKIDLQKQQMKILMSKIPKSILEEKLFPNNTNDQTKNSQVQSPVRVYTSPIDPLKTQTSDTTERSTQEHSKTVRAWPQSKLKKITSPKTFFTKTAQTTKSTLAKSLSPQKSPIKTQYHVNQIQRGIQDKPRQRLISPPFEQREIVPPRSILAGRSLSPLQNKNTVGLDIFKPIGLIDQFFVQRTKESIRKIRKENPEVHCFQMQDEDIQKDLIQLRDLVVKQCLDLIIFDFLCHQLMHSKEKQIITQSETLKQKLYFVFRKVIEKSREKIYEILQEELEYRELFIQIIQQFESPEQTQQTIQSSILQKQLSQFHKKLAQKLFEKYPIIKDIFTSFQSNGWNLLDNLIHVQIQDDDPDTYTQKMNEQLKKEGAFNPFSPEFNATSNDYILDLIYQDDIEMEAITDNDIHFKVDIEGLKKKVLSDQKLQNNCLIYLQFAQSLGQCNQLEKNDFHFNLLVCELGPVLFITRNIIFQYELFIDRSLEPNHIRKMVTYLGIEREEFDLYWIAYLFCVVLIKFTLPEEKILTKFFEQVINIPHKVFFLQLVDHNRIKKEFYQKNFHRFEDYIKDTNWFKFFDETDHFYYYNFKLQQKKNELSKKQFYHIEKFVLLEKQELLRLVLGMNYLVYGKELEIKAMPNMYQDESGQIEEEDSEQ